MSSNGLHRWGEALVVLAMVCTALFWIWAAGRLPVGFAQASVGPGRFPALAAIGLLIAAGAVGLGVIRQRGSAAEPSAPGSLTGVVFIASVIAMVLSFDWFGFYPTAAVWVAFAVAWLGSRRLALPVAAGFCVAAWLIFDFALGVPLP